MLDYEKIEKPRQIKKNICRQHLQWMDVTGKQAKANFAQHVAQVKKNGGRVK